MKYRHAIDRGKALNERTSPGRGADMPDDGLGAPLKMKSVPNVPTERLRRSLEFYHGSIHTEQGLHDFDQPRRSLIETGMKARSITHELKLRGENPGECKHCWGE